MDRFEKARRKYKPQEIEYLMVAETPPKLDSDRFFYFEKVDEQDSLFLETMKVLYPNETEFIDTKEIRKKKKDYLEKFKNDGFYLIDSLDEPFEEKHSSSQKIKMIKEGQNQLFLKIKELVSENTKIILVAATVFKANFEFLKSKGISVINIESIDFPGSGGQKKFREKMRAILK